MVLSPGSATPASDSAPANRLATLPPWPWDPFDREAPRTIGYHIWAWSEGSLGEFYPDKFTGLIQPNGPRSGQIYRATRDQARWWLWWYAVDDEGQWLFSHGVRRLAKGSGKSPFAAVSGLGEFCAPVRLDRFDDRMPGGCRGRPVDMPLVQIAATAESQTANTMRMVRAYAPKRSPIVEQYALDPGKQLYYKLPEGTLQVITSSASSAEGAEPSCIIEDETEHWKPSNGGPELAATLEDNLAKSGARSIETANSWVPGQQCVAEASWDAWVLQEEGRTRGETKILYDARIAPADTDLADPESLKSALEFVYDDCDWKKPTPDAPPDVRSIMERIWAPQSKVDDSKKKYLNWPTASYDAWVLPEEWNQLADASVKVAKGEEIVLFFDGSKSRDATALIGCRLDDGHIFTLGIWEPDPAHNDDETIDFADVDRAVILAFAMYSVVAFFADVREWESFTLTEWPRRYAGELEIWSVPSGKPPHSIAWDMRSHKDEFAKAAEAAQSEIVEGGFTHDGNSILGRHVGNARRRPYKDMISIGKESPDSAKKIDGAVCVIGARMVRRLVLSSAKRKKKRTGEVW